ncbi:hypothetical protein AMTR_s00019p00135050 [Amborella trichopoda]|uniref:Uncharacterized protein n=1 Tax=Amborella trichopoda TaxID=13333 RepID=W1PHI6_AMBTC|nr:hypothetical protein AMTR_s00019p00135050 [Amborella trichopoda]
MAHQGNNDGGAEDEVLLYSKEKRVSELVGSAKRKKPGCYTLEVDGKPVLTRNYGDYHEYLLEWLGDCLEEENLMKLKYTQLRENFMQLLEDATKADIERRTKAYLIYLVGKTIFCDPNSNEVPNFVRGF